MKVFLSYQSLKLDWSNKVSAMKDIVKKTASVIFLTQDRKIILILYHQCMYRKVPSSYMSRLETHAGFFSLLMKGIFDPYVL